jgi:hypothetical protein
MAGHRIEVEFSHYVYGPGVHVICDEPAGALCRAQWDCDCEEFSEVGVDEHGPWHVTYAWEGPASESDRHYGKPGSPDCNYALFVEESGAAAELGHGTLTAPVSFTWDGDGYEWHVEVPS